MVAAVAEAAAEAAGAAAAGEADALVPGEADALVPGEVDRPVAVDLADAHLGAAAASGAEAEDERGLSFLCRKSNVQVFYNDAFLRPLMTAQNTSEDTSLYEYSSSGRDSIMLIILGDPD